MKKFILIICLIFACPSPAKAVTTTTSLATVNTDIQPSYSPLDLPIVSISSTTSFKQRFAGFIAKIQGKNTNPSIQIINPKNKEVLSKAVAPGKSTITISKQDLSPGEYTIKLENQNITTFSWGVLVINSDQDLYLPDQVAHFSLASLNSSGHTLCRSHLSLSINNQNIPVMPSSSCGKDNVTDLPDYTAQLKLGSAGLYKLKLTNLDTNLSIEKELKVQDQIDYTIKRKGATRINPFKSDYRMTIEVSSKQNFQGTIQETIPPEFEAKSPLSWDIRLAAGDSTQLSYIYHAPQISPAIYFLGPLTMGNQFESGTWGLASDAGFEMQTGYYIGDGTDNRAITSVDFQPDLVIIKDDDGTGSYGIIWKSSSMSSETSAYFFDVADIATNNIQSLDATGFTLGTDIDVNDPNTRYTWVAFGSSDCSATGSFCIGSYTGDGTASHAITSVGFNPDLVIVKSSTSTGFAKFKTTSMAANTSSSLIAQNEVTDGSELSSLDPTGFTTGNSSQTNANGVNYWYIAFNNNAGNFAEGNFTGDGTSVKSISTGFDPQYVWVKNSTATTPIQAGFNLTESYGDYTGRPGDNSHITNWITGLGTSSFTVGSDVAVNESGKSIYWFAFGGSPALSFVGTYNLKLGTYTGNGTSKSITGLGFTPSLVMIKEDTGSNFAVFRTSLMKGDSTADFANTTNNFTGGITSLDSDGFSLGSNATVNTNSTIYHYQAFGNAWNPETGQGASDFAIGAYTGNSLDNRNITRLPFQPNFVGIKNIDGTASGLWRISSESGDLSLGFGAGIAEGANYIQALNSDGFQLGTDVRANQSGLLHHWFAFKASNTMAVGNYTGTGSAQNITSVGFGPSLVWARATGAISTIVRPSTIVTDSTIYLANSAAASDRITSLLSNGFALGGTHTDSNSNGATYRFAAWAINTSPSTPTLDSPADGASSVSLTPTLQTTSTDPNSDYLQYKLEICQNISFTIGCIPYTNQPFTQSGWSGQNAAGSTAYSSGTQASYTLQTSLSYNTTYYWRSYAIDPVGTNIYSATQTPRSFSTMSGAGTSTMTIDGIKLEGISIN